MWNFSRHSAGKRLALGQHPHFYRKLPEKYGDGFQRCPIDTFCYDQISVLTDNSSQAGRIYLEIPKRKRIFSNVWDARGTIIFKGSWPPFVLSLSSYTLSDIFGRLEGESIIGSVIKDTPNLWCFEEPPRSRSHTSQQSFSTTSTTLNSSSSAMSPTPTTSTTGELVGDWMEPIRRMTRSSLDMNIRISPIVCQRQLWGIKNEMLLPPATECPQSRLPQKPETFARSSTPLLYKTVQSKPLSLSRQSPVAELSPRSPTPPSPETPPVLPSYLTLTQAPRTSAPFPMPRPPPLILLPPLGPAIPAQTSHSLPGTSSRAESQEDTVGDHPSQSTTTDPDDKDEDPSLSDDASTVTPASQQRKGRKWYQKIFDRVSRRGSSQ